MRRTPRISIFLLSIHLLSLLISSGASEEPLERSVERFALIQFKKSIRNDPAGFLNQWKESEESDHCSWPGISCDEESRVIEISISGRRESRLIGSISPAIGRLSELISIRLNFHNFSGGIPFEIWGLKSLEFLDLAGNGLSGSVPSRFPSSISDCGDLTVIDLSRNKINGQIPEILRFCSSLKLLNLSFNLLEGVLPSDIGRLSKLELLDLSRNRINGRIPKNLGICSGLRWLNLSFNLLEGVIPSELGRLSRLELLDLSRNKINGPIPPEIGFCSDLKLLNLSFNLLQDELPPELGRLSKLELLDVSKNSLSSFIPVEIGDCRELSTIVLTNPDEEDEEFNFFMGAVPEEITSLPKLTILWAPRSSLQGFIPANWGSCDFVRAVNLAQNQLTGPIPSFDQCKNLNHLNLSFNNFSGLLPDQLPIACMDIFDISGNQISGSIHNFSCNLLRSEPILRSVIHRFSGNAFSGSLPQLPIIPNKLLSYELSADSNNLTGEIPAFFFDPCKDLTGLKINISRNMIEGEIPKNMNLCNQSLTSFDASRNLIRGEIPQNLGSIRSLQELDLSRNSITGEIPPDLDRLKDLKSLILGRNKIIGEIPPEIGLMSSIQILDLSSNNLSGLIPEDLSKLRSLSVLLLHDNNLSGRFPSSLARLVSLSVFDVSGNNLSGSIPVNAGELICTGAARNPLLQPCAGKTRSLGIPPLSDRPDHQWDGHGLITASAVSGAAVFSLLLALVMIFFFARGRIPAIRSGRHDLVIFADVGVPLTFEGIVRSTGNFNASNCIGSGGFGATYKAEIAPGLTIAIKRLSVGRFHGVQQFHAEVKTLGRWAHPNLVTLLGYHASESEMFLIYNYLPGGNLESFIQERSTRAVDWRALHRIGLDVARALAHLHDRCVPRILHRDVKPSNILLDNLGRAFLSDFGLARLLGGSETHATTGVAGTFGYVAPEYALTCRVSDKADVYSYGVVLMELLSDKKALDPSFSPYGNGFNIVGWASKLSREGRPGEFFFDGLWAAGPQDDLVEALTLAVLCTADSPAVRPPMRQVVQVLCQLQPDKSI